MVLVNLSVPHIKGESIEVRVCNACVVLTKYKLIDEFVGFQLSLCVLN